jgi:hypothetical protein
LVDWVAFLRSEKGFGPEDPLFPKSRVETGADLRFVANGVDRAHWANAHPVRAIFKEAFRWVGLPYFNPHSFRNTLVQLAYELKLNAEQFKAWSQNLGHEQCLTTFSSYGTLPPHRQAEAIRGLAEPQEPRADFTPDVLRRIADQSGKECPYERHRRSSIGEFVACGAARALFRRTAPVFRPRMIKRPARWSRR